MLIRITITRLLIFVLLPLATTLHAQQAFTQRKLLNFDWKFTIGDDSLAIRTGYNDKNWQTVNLPHDGSIAGDFDTLTGSRQNGFRPRHIGWYRKTFTIQENTNNKIVILQFEGVYRAAEVWLNGTYLGKHLNGYTGFSYDITKQLKPGVPNTLAIRYDNTYKQSSRWYTGEGIYRNVWLCIQEPLHIKENGVFITTPIITNEQAGIHIQTDVFNQSDSTTTAILTSTLLSPQGKELKVLTSTVPLQPHEQYTFHQYTNVEQPQRWDLPTPVQYKIKSSLAAGGNSADETNTAFGIRTLAFTPEEGFLLNGRKVFLNGVNIHHDLGPLGAAAFDKGFYRRLQGLKKMGVNAIRLAHNPHATAVLNMCDEMGILVFDESFDKWSQEYYGPGEKFEQHWQPDLEWFIRRDRNHPSVFLWSVGNEVFVKQEYKDRGFVEQYKKMAAVVNMLDPSRKVTAGLYPARDENQPAPMAFYMDVVSDNYMTRFYKRDHPKFPQLVFLASEMTTDNGGENFFNYDHSYACGQFYWGGTDYIGESFAWPSKGWNGIIDWCDFWKPISYYIKSLYSPEPMVKIALFDATHSDARVWNDVFMNTLKMSDSWNWKAGQKLTLYTFTTGDEVELLLNGRSVGIKKLKDHPKNKIAWELNYAPGIIKAIARKNGKDIAIDELRTAGQPARILLNADTAAINADGLDLAYITVTVVDNKGIVVPDAENDIRFDITGEGELAGVANSNRLSDERFVANHRKAYEGKCLLVVRSKTQTGKITIKAVAKGLQSAQLVIDAVPVKE
jgi:beta-galactosidase